MSEDRRVKGNLHPPSPIKSHMLLEDNIPNDLSAVLQVDSMDTITDYRGQLLEFQKLL